MELTTAIMYSHMENMPVVPKSFIEEQRRVTRERLVFWLVIPLGLSIITALTVPDDTIKLRVLLVIYAFVMLLFRWVTFHVMTHFAARFLVPKSWREVQNSVFPGLIVLCIGNLIGNLLLFPTRQLRADLYCLVAQQLEAACYVLQPTNLMWDWAGDFLRLTLVSMLYWLLANYIVASLFNVRRYGFRVSHLKPLQQQPSTIDAETSPLLSRIPFELGDDVIFLSANQHYIDVHTRKGSALVLYRLSDAVKEMGDRGAQIHRSYWVAYDAIRAIKRDGSSLQVVLEDGRSIPVSRGYRQIFKSGKFQRMQLG